MSEFSNDPMSPESAPEMSLIETWMEAFTKPNESTFERIAAQPSASASKAFLWVFVASLFTTFVTFVVQTINFGGQAGFRQFLPPELANQLPASAVPSIGLGTVICGAPVGAIFAVIGFAIATALVQWVAKMFGGTGTFDKLAYAFSAITVPYSVVTAVLTLFGLIPFVGNILAGLGSFALSIYLIVLEVLAVKAVDRLDTGKAVGAVLLPVLVIFLLVCCCAIAVAAFLVPVMRESSFSLYQNLGAF